MNITLTWDLFIIVFFAIVITYSFIIGRMQSVKIIVASYIAIVAVQGIGNILQRILSHSAVALKILGLSLNIELISITKLVLFVVILIALAIWSGLELKYNEEPGFVLHALLTALFGFATAGLLVSTLVTYAAGVPLLDQNLPNVKALSPVIAQSQLMQAMILNQDIWFSLPALLLLAAGFVGNRN